MLCTSVLPDMSDIVQYGTRPVHLYNAGRDSGIYIVNTFDNKER